QGLLHWGGRDVAAAAPKWLYFSTGHVMQENYVTVASLGSPIPKPNLISCMERGDESSRETHPGRARRNPLLKKETEALNVDGAPSDTSGNPRRREIL
uniref:Uncharacterized protein n=1 Tax=Terrapene triunguis TaxID=2587831 RepID=A0A674KGA0_9SAUR